MAEIDFITTEELDSIDEIIPNAWVVAVDLENSEAYRITMENFLVSVSNVNLTFDFGSFI